MDIILPSRLYQEVFNELLRFYYCKPEQLTPLIQSQSYDVSLKSVLYVLMTFLRKVSFILQSFYFPNIIDKL